MSQQPSKGIQVRAPSRHPSRVLCPARCCLVNCDSNRQGKHQAQPVPRSCQSTLLTPLLFSEQQGDTTKIVSCPPLTLRRTTTTNTTSIFRSTTTPSHLTVEV